MRDTSLMGRADIVILHHDGNNNDPDDHSSMVIGSLLTKAAGHQSKTHLFFGNNLAEPNNKAMLSNARAAADYAEQLGIKTHDYQADISGTTAELVSLLNSGKNVLVIEGGPMEATYRAMEQVSASNHSNITLVSHSSWNEERVKNDLGLKTSPRDWSDLKADFSDATFIDISDQNKNYKTSSGWSWLDNENDSIFDLNGATEILGEGREIMEAAGKILAVAKSDPSDAGMVAYALTGRQDFTPAETRQYFIDNWVNISAVPAWEPEPQPAPEPAPEPGELTFDLAIAYDSGKLIDGDLRHGEVLALDDLDDGRVTMVATPSAGVGSVKLDLVGVHERVETAAPYVLFGDVGGDYLSGTTLGAGDYKVVLTGYSGSSGGGSVLGSQTIAFSVADQAAPAPAPEPAPEAGVVYRWNAGTSTVAATDGGLAWMADAGAIVGSAQAASSPIAGSGTLDASVPGTTPTGIFADEYWGSSANSPMELEFGGGTLADGTYAVRLFMGDGYSKTNDPGERVFDVRIEDELFRDELDLSGTLGHLVGGMFEWRGTVDDGTVDIDFIHGVENPLINGVEIIRLDGTAPSPSQPSGPAAGQLTLLDATNDVALFDLGPSVVLDAAAVAGLSFSVEANAGDGTGSVRFLLDGSSVRVENAGPYVMFGATGSNYRDGFRLADGDVVEIGAEFFSSGSAGGQRLGEVTSTIRVEDGPLSGTRSSADTFAFDVTEMGSARVRGMEEIDSLALFGTQGLSAGAALDRAKLVNGDTVLDFGDGNVLTLEDYRSLSADDLIF